MRSIRRWIWTVLGVAFVASCADGSDRLQPVDGVAHTEGGLDFGPVLLGSSVERQLAVENVGRAPMRILGVERIEPFPADFGVETREQLVEPGEKRVISVRFAPGELGPKDGLFRLRTDSRGQPDVAVAVSGRGVDASGLPNATVLDFGNVPVMSSEDRTLVLRNAGEVEAQARVTAPQGVDQDLFVVAPGGLGNVRVLPAGALGIPVTFHPTRLGPADAWITLVPCPICVPVVVRLLGNGVASVLVADPVSVDFGFSPLGGEPDCRTVRLQNVGSSAVGYLGVDLAPGTTADFSVSGPSLGAMEPGGTVQARVCFQPTSSHELRGAFRFLTNDSRAPRILVPLTGAGGGPEVDCVPTLLDFGVEMLGASKTMKVVCTNLGSDLLGGGGELVIKKTNSSSPGTRIQGDVEFHVVLSADVKLLAGESYALQVIYQPVDERADVAKLIIATNDADEAEIEINLRGSALEAAPCEYQLIPPRLEFGLVAVGARPRLDFAVENIGTDACVISDLYLASASSTAFTLLERPPPSTTVWPGERLLVPVRFAPMQAGPAEGAVEFYVNHQTDPLVVVPLTAQAGEGCLHVAPGTLSFGKVGVACSPRALAATLTNTCAMPVTVDSMALGGGTSSEFRIDSPGEASFVVQPGESVQLVVTYDPTGDGDDSAPLYVHLAGQSEPLLLALVGEGETNPNQTDEFTQDDRPEADVLFVMDNSGSMMEEQDGLARSFPQFMATALADNWDFHIGVTTTGVLPSAPSCPGGAHGGEAGRLFPVDNSSPRIITPDTAEPQGVFEKNITVGLCHWWEEGLEAAYLALSNPLVSSADDPRTPISNDGNLGFLRPDVRLSVIYISDEDDYSARPVQDYVAQLQGLKPGHPELVTASAIVSDGACTTASSTGTRYMQVARATGGVVASICSPDWSAVLQNIADATFSGRSRFTLSRTPAYDAIVVVVGGKEVPQLLADGTRAWIHDPTDNSIVFSPGSVPGVGAVVAISYPVACN